MKIKVFYMKSWHHILAFALPILFLGLVYAVFGIYPFGSKSLLIKDMAYQYTLYFNHFYDVFKNGESLFYSWQTSLGMNFFGIFGYYLSSPFSLIILLFSKPHFPEAIVAITLAKVGASGLTMSFYLKKAMGIKNVNSLALSVSYALMSYCVIYAQNIMWLDGIVLLPLVLLGIEQILNKQKTVIFSISIALLFISNFYISYMVGIFSACYFIIRYLELFHGYGWRLFFRKIGLFVFGTLLAIGMSGIMIVPTYFALTQIMHVPLHVHGIGFSFPVPDLIAKLFNGMYDSISNTGLPNVYTGLYPLILSVSFFLIKEIPTRIKWLYGSLVIFLVVSFELPILNLAWHGFNFPDFYPYRYSFVFSFLMIYLAGRCLPHLSKNAKALNIVFTFLIMIALLLENLCPKYMSLNVALINVLFLSLFFVLLKLKINKVKGRTILNLLLIVFLALDSSSNAFLILRGLNKQYGFKPRHYYKVNPALSQALGKMKATDNGFYRIQNKMSKTYNDPYRFQYKGIRHFSSMTNNNLVMVLRKLGYTTDSGGKWVSNVGGTLFSNSLLDLKYTISPTAIDQFGYQKVGHDLYKNSLALPIGFLTNNLHDKNWDNIHNPLVFQMKVINDLSKTRNNKILGEIKPLKTSYQNVKVVHANGRTIYRKINDAEKASVHFTFHIKRSAQFYTFLNRKDMHLATISINHQAVKNYPSTYNNGVLNLGRYANQAVSLKIALNRDEITLNDHLFFTLDVERFKRLVDQLRQDPFIVDSYSGSSLKGHIHAKHNGGLFLSIPYDSGWSVKIDGKNTKIQRVFGDFMLLHVSKGDHTIQMNYISPGFRIGLVISSISVLLFIAYLFVIRIRGKNEFTESS